MSLNGYNKNFAPFSFSNVYASHYTFVYYVLLLFGIKYFVRVSYSISLAHVFMEGYAYNFCYVYVLLKHFVPEFVFMWWCFKALSSKTIKMVPLPEDHSRQIK